MSSMASVRDEDRVDRRDAILNAMVDSIVIIDQRGRILDTNAAVEAQFGYMMEELIGQDVSLLMPEPHSAKHQSYIDAYLTTGVRKVIGLGRRVQARRKDGSLLDIELTLTETIVDGKRIFAGILKDISTQVERERLMRRQRDDLTIQARVNDIVQNATTPEFLLTDVLTALTGLAEIAVKSMAGIFLIDFESTRGTTSCDRPLERPEAKGLRLVKTIGDFTDEFLEHEAWIPIGSCLCGRAALTGQVIVSGNCSDDPRHEFVFRGMKPHGHYIIPLRSQGGVIGVVFLYTDPDPWWDKGRISLFETLGNQIGVALDRLWTMGELQASRDQLYQLATQDELTRLPNRRAVLGRLKRERERLEGSKTSISLIMVDIDHFKVVNDTAGHAVGDDVLAEIARRLAEAIRSYDMVGRLGGEEFLAVLPDVDLSHALVVAERIRRMIAERPVRCRGDREIRVTVSAGVSSSRLRGIKELSDDAFIVEADTAMYVAKRNGRNRVELARNLPPPKPDTSSSKSP